MKADLRDGVLTRAAAAASIDVFAEQTAAASTTRWSFSTKDRDALLAFFDFPAEHWDHLRTSNPILRAYSRWSVIEPYGQKGALLVKTANPPQYPNWSTPPRKHGGD